MIQEKIMLWTLTVSATIVIGFLSLLIVAWLVNQIVPLIKTALRGKPMRNKPRNIEEFVDLLETTLADVPLSPEEEQEFCQESAVDIERLTNRVKAIIKKHAEYAHARHLEETER